MTEIKLRDYQNECIDAVFTAWSDGMLRPAVVLPTGAGKTVVFAALIKRFRDWQTSVPIGASEPIPQWPDKGHRVIVLAHRDELVDQAIAKLRAVLPADVSVGKVKAADNEVDADVMVCSVQTLASARRRSQLFDGEERNGKVGLIVTDECHHAAAASYKAFYSAYPDALQLGVTATMARGDGIGLGKVWEEVVYSRSILWMISKGYLTDVRTKHIDLKALDMGAVKASRGDWQAGDLGRALMESEADTAIARAYKEHAGGRRGIVFTPTVETAEAATTALGRAGITAQIVHGDTPRESRQWAYEQFRTGRTQVLVNCMVLTEGFDAPWAEVAVIARPTQSAPLYTQMVGRVLRPWPGKTEALVLDLVGASANKLRTLIDLEEPGAVKAVADGESLAEAVVREEEESNAVVRQGSIAFDLKARDVDAFAASDHAWMFTPKGVMFINTGACRVFLWPASGGGADGLWDVCVQEPKKKWERSPYTGLSVGEAMAWGEALAEDHAAFSTAKSARWRKSPPSDAQLSFAANLGIEGAADMNRGQVSAAIEAVTAARVFDRYVKG